MWELAATRSPAEIIVGAVTFSVTLPLLFLARSYPRFCRTAQPVLFRLMSPVWKVLEHLCAPVSWLLLRMGNVVEKGLKEGYSTTVGRTEPGTEITTENDETTAEEKTY